MKSREEIEAYLDLHHITLTHGRVDAIYALYQNGWSDGFEDCNNFDGGSSVQTKTLTCKGLAERLNGREYGREMNKTDEAGALKNGLCVVFGASDDLMEFRGAIAHEAGAWEGVNIAITENAVLEDPENFESFEHKIKAVWGKDGISWTYETDIPHETFDIMEGENVYCRGIVFSVKNVCDDPDAIFVWGERINKEE